MASHRADHNLRNAVRRGAQIQHAQGRIAPQRSEQSLADVSVDEHILSLPSASELEAGQRGVRDQRGKHGKRSSCEDLCDFERVKRGVFGNARAE